MVGYFALYVHVFKKDSSPFAVKPEPSRVTLCNLSAKSYPDDGYLAPIYNLYC